MRRASIFESVRRIVNNFVACAYIAMISGHGGGGGGGGGAAV